MNIRKARKLRDILFFVGFLVMLPACIYDPLIYVGAVIAFSGLIPDFLYNKCPNCGRRLGRNEGEFCQFCGGSLAQEEAPT